MHPRLAAVVPHTLMLVVSGVLYYAATYIETGGPSGRLGPGSWPKFIILAMAALCIYEICKRLLVGTSFTATGLAQGLNRPPDDANRELAGREPQRHNRKLAAGIALVSAFVVGVAYVGFFVGTALFLALFAWIGGYRRPVILTIVSVLGALALLVVFMRVAYVSLPLGSGPFRTVSLALLRLIGV
jgi:hypothetical protein